MLTRNDPSNNGSRCISANGDFPGHFSTHGAHTPEDWDRFREFAEPFGRQLAMVI